MNLLSNPLATPATELIRSDHEAVFALYHRLHPRTPPRMRQALARRICTALEVHAQLEEELFYPALREAGIELGALDKGLAEHVQMRMLIGRVHEADRPEALREALADVMNCVLHHVADEETIVLPAAEQRMSATGLIELCTRMRARRVELMKDQPGPVAADAARSAPGRGVLAALAVLAGTVWMMGRSRHAVHSLHTAGR